jgi:hypothetical protein
VRGKEVRWGKLEATMQGLLIEGIVRGYARKAKLSQDICGFTEMH